ncbi:hypothetical protein BG011_009970 [Mortierella polycephala]|uniref:RZ-type domain-containing protein n=1 Tax=Mortierella polycephala TaxID=41804 RepID=A0A9P6PLD8_9FUNG|nr:hypothetical protein BG011_009970 [Mortierella polycephala]
MGIVVDMIMQATLAEVDVDEDPIMVLSCGHVLTMSTLDGMMEMNDYYQGQINNLTGSTTFIGKRHLPSGVVSQVNCHLCRQPIVGLLRYGRRIKYGQLSMRMKKYKIVQARFMKKAQNEFDANWTSVQEGQARFLEAISKTVAGPCSLPLDEESQRLGKHIDQTQPFPDSEYHKIATTYSIPMEHEEAWIKLLEPLDRSLKRFTAIYKSAVQSPTKQLFDAAVSHLYRLKTAPNIHPSKQKDGSTYDVQPPVKPTMADDVIRICILECGLPLDGHGESSYVDSLQERVNVLRLVLEQASIVLDKVGVNTGWYWFVNDLIQCCLAHADIHLGAAIKGSYMRQATYSRLNRMDLLLKHLQWIGLSPMPKDDAAKQARQDQAGGIMMMFFEEFDQTEKSCPESMKPDCAQRLVVLREKMDNAIMVADGKDRYRPVSRAEKFEVFRVVSQQLGGSGHWYQCPNGHTYVIADCGMAMTQSACPECGESIGGGHHALLRSNRLDQEFEEMYRQRQ